MGVPFWFGFDVTDSIEDEVMDGALKSLSVKSATLLGGGDSVSLAPRGLGDVMEEEELFGDEVDPDLSLDRHIAKVKCTKKY